MGSETIYDVMNCKAVATVGELPTGDFVLEPKLDGFRLLAEVVQDGVRFHTRSGKLKVDGKLPHIADQLSAAFPPGTILDGEIVALRQEEGGYVNDFEWVQGVMLSLPDRAVESQQRFGRWLQYVAFDMLRLGEEDLRGEKLVDRKNTLEATLAVSQLVHVSGMPTFPATQEQHETLVQLGFEGSIAKEKSSTYQSGKRGRGWFKLKNQPTVDVVIIGYQDGREGKFFGQVGAVEFGQPVSPERLKELQANKKLEWRAIDGVMYLKRGQCSGFDDAERRHITDNQGAYLGTVMEVAHMGIYPNGVTMRHPQFKSFRPDRTPESVEWHDG